MKRRWPAVALAIPAAIIIFAISVILFIPARELEGVIDRALAESGYTLRAAEFAKALPLGLKARQMELSDERGVLLRADTAVVRLRLLPLLGGKLSFGYRAVIGGGDVHGVFSTSPGDEANVEVEHLRLEDIPFFATATGAAVKGDLQGEASFRGRGDKAAGSARLEVKGAELAAVKIGGMPLPDASYDLVRGALKVSGGKAVLESFTLEGKGLYVRLRGDFPVTLPLGAAPLDLTLELMPKPEFMEKQKFVFLLLAKYLVTPGAYRIPVRGTLANPAIQ
ncbi:MAG TPA: type II secretion system protein GspN [Geobacteraceae bacterium]|nr:type II secretion system protein GspN [Geobacteraceae bacterium]